MKKKMTPWGITIQTNTHGEDVDAAAVDDDQIGFCCICMSEDIFYLLCEIVFSMTTET